MGVQTVIERLRNRHGQVRAHRLAVLEQQKARRARCRKRFQFWGTVADQIGIELTRDALWAVLEDGVTEPTGDLSASSGELLLPRPAIRPSVSLRG